MVVLPSDNNTNDSQSRDSRSSSPAKRRADEMESDKSQPMDLTDEYQPPSLDDQVSEVYKEASNQCEEEGAAGYVISIAWLSRVVIRTKHKDEMMGNLDKSYLEGEIGQIDNSDIISDDNSALRDENGLDFVALKPGLRMDADFYILPKSAWNKVVLWHGLKSGQAPIIRYNHATIMDDSSKDWKYEIYPPIFTLRRLLTDSSETLPAPLDPQRPAPRIIRSRSEKYVDFLKSIKQVLSIPIQSKITVGRVIEIQSTTEAPELQDANNSVSMISPPASRENTPSSTIVAAATAASSSIPTWIITSDELHKLKDAEMIEIIDRKDESMNANYNGSANLDLLGLRVDQTLIIECPKSKTVENKKSNVKSITIKDPTSETSSGRASPASSGIMTRGRFRSQNRPKGPVGLTNLGNTCYMNSAIQCMRACQELTLYFLSDSWKADLNPHSRVGHKGQVAKAYGDLLHGMYSDNGNSFTPRNFKSTLSRLNPTFAGYGQQDSQEFMSFLVDNLNEDLNKVTNRPYIENPDSDDILVNDPEYLKELGQKYQEIYTARNQSVIADLFNGSYKNKLVCLHPGCGKININFDPYSLLTLQLPIEQHWQSEFTYVPSDGPPIRMTIDNSKGLSVQALIDFAASRFPESSSEKMVMAEVFTGKIFKIIDNHLSLAEVNISPQDEMFIYDLPQIPAGRPFPEKFKSMLDIDDEPSDAHFPAVIYHLTSTQGTNCSLWPAMTTLTKSEASNYDEILRKVLIAISNQTTRNFEEILAAEESDSEVSSTSDHTEENGVTEEAQSTSEIQTESLDEDYVDIKMVNGDDSESAAVSWKEPGAPIPDVLQNLFDLYAAVTSERATNYSHSYEKNLTAIKDRLPKPPASPETSDESTNSPDATIHSEDEATDEVTEIIETGSQISVADSEIDSIAKPGSNRNKMINRKGKGKHAKYSKGRKNAPQPSLKQSVLNAQAYSSDERLVKTNEVIYLSWKPKAYDYLFSKQYDARNQNNIKLKEDEELNTRAKERKLRQQQGMTLEQCFEETAKAEILSEDNAWYCPRCKEHRVATKQLDIWTVPDILVIHLKRFSSGRGLRDKVDGKVDFPIEGLDLTGKVGTAENKELVYDLFAIDNHYGGLGGGHYTAFAKNFMDGEWYEFNDSHVSKRSSKTIVTGAAYLLFYRRRSNGPLGSPELQAIVQKYLHGVRRNSDASDSSQSTDRLDDSGNGQQLDDLSYAGSSNTLHAPAATRLHQTAGSVKIQLVNTDDELDEPQPESTGILTSFMSEDKSPAYEDEGISMPEDDEAQYEPWPPGIGLQNRNDNDGDDNASNTAADGDHVGNSSDSGMNDEEMSSASVRIDNSKNKQADSEVLEDVKQSVEVDMHEG